MVVNDLEVVILAGGLGSRLKTLVPNKPKPMANINGSPFLEILIKHLSGQGVSNIILSVGYKAEIIQEYFGFNFCDVEIQYSLEDKPLGTGGAIRLASKKVKNEKFLVINGDTFVDLDLEDFLKFNLMNEDLLLAAVPVSDTARCGTVNLSGNLVVEILEKNNKGSGLINAGCYLINRKTLDSIDVCTEFSFERELLPKLVEERSVRAVICEGDFIDIGVPEDYHAAQKMLVKHAL